MDITDEQAFLLERARRGDAAAFGRLVAEYQPAVYTLCRQVLDDPDEAADVTQDTFVAAWVNLRSIRGDLRSWLFKVAINRCRDRLRRRRRLVAGPPADRADPAPDGQPEEAVLAAERQELVRCALRELDPDQRLAVVLADLFGYAYSEIAALTGWPVGTVRSRIHRGRLGLRAALLKRPELLSGE